jgi:HAD superfamily hydrolase (TIGR01509 family)
MKYIAAIFDMDGLLIDSERLALLAFEQTCEHFGLKGSFALYAQLLGTNETTTRRILKNELSADIDLHAFTAHWEAIYYQSTKNGVPLMKGVLKLLNYLEQNGIPSAVATSTQTDKATDKLAKAKVLERFVSVTGGDQVSNGKPAPDIYLMAAQRLGADPKRCITLEDSPNGVRSAVAAGTHAIQIPDILQPDDELLKLGHTVLTDLSAVPEYLNTLRCE